MSLPLSMKAITMESKETGYRRTGCPTTEASEHLTKERADSSRLLRAAKRRTSNGQNNIFLLSPTGVYPRVVIIMFEDFYGFERTLYT